MQIALDKNGKRVSIDNASKIHTYYCPQCGNELSMRLGQIRIHHFAHKSNLTCHDSWHYDDQSEWHRNWQNRFAENYREVYREVDGKKHRADILIEDKKLVIEFQHSKLTSEEFDERNSFYSSLGYRIIWVFDFIKDFENGYVEFHEGHGFEINEKRNIFQNMGKFDNRIDLFFQFEAPAEENRRISEIKKYIEVNPEYFDYASFSDEVSENEDYYEDHKNDSGCLSRIIVPKSVSDFLYTDICDDFTIQEFIDYINGKYKPDSSITDYTGSLFELWAIGKCKIATFYNIKTEFYVRITSDPELCYEKYNGKCYGIFSKDKYSFNPNHSREINNADERIWKLIWKK